MALLSRSHTFQPYSCKLMTIGYLTIILVAVGFQSSASAGSSYHQTDHTSSILASSTQQTLRSQALRIQHELSERNYAAIVNDIHPLRGVRFSMYAHILPESDKVFRREQFTQYLDQSRIRFTWGAKDGTGDPLVIPLPEYLDTWVAAEDFDNTSLCVNEPHHYGGNAIHNAKSIYPDSDVVDFYYNGSDLYDGMDWRVLRLVFESYQGQRYLVAIINDQWTI